MNAERHAQIRDVFLGALECPGEQRADFLAKTCGDDAELRREVESLLGEHQSKTILPHDRVPVRIAEPSQESSPQPEPSTQPDAPVATFDADRAFESGTVIANRYRIVSLLGRGGMGEVYRADDVTLDHAVALKFLPSIVSQEPVWRARLENEVRMAREVTHPNVCRIYDIGDHEGDAFISMEYVDGEDLKTLIRRIGRVPRDKALDIARHLCFGLAAAHIRGVLHRDFKPSNIMIDGRGRVRITDFGLAGLAGQIRSAEVRAGTPGYMAPEQLTGTAVTQRSDIYSLGLVLYELFTGQRAFTAKSPAEYQKLHTTVAPRPPSSIVENFDPDIERAILRCLEKDPVHRPESALAVAAALPGGDLLATVLAAGETPSPELVAAAGESRRMSTPQAATGLVVFFTLLLALVWLSGKAQTLWQFPPSLSRQSMIDRASGVLSGLGCDSRTGDVAYGFDHSAIVQTALHLGESANPSRPPLAGGPDTLVFWYRHCATALVPDGARNLAFRYARVCIDDPPPNTPGTTTIVMDHQGRVVLVQSVPAYDSAGVTPATTPADWSNLIRRAGLSDRELAQSESGLLALPFCDAGMAWTGMRESSNDRVRVEAGTWRGRPVFWGVFDETATSADMSSADQRQRVLLLSHIFTLVILLLVPIAIPAARQHLRTGRGDRRGATRIAVGVMTIRLVAWLLIRHPTGDFFVEIEHLLIGYAGAAGEAVIVWISYVALEPYVRQFWPYALIGWTRVLHGRFRDTLVARNILLGSVLGVALCLFMRLDALLPVWFGWSGHALVDDRIGQGAIIGLRAAIGTSLDGLRRGGLDGLSILMLMVAMRRLARPPRLADACTLALLAVLFVPRGAHLGISWLTIGLFGVGTVIWTLTRHGLLAVMTAFAVFWTLRSSALTLDTRCWYADAGFLTLMLPAAIALYGFVHARRQPSAPRSHT